LPEKATPTGYCTLIDAYELNVPLPRTLYATGDRHRITTADGWHILTPRHRPEASLGGHLTFALKHEGLAARDLSHRAQEVAADIPRDVMSRTAALLLLKDSRASYAIEGERAPAA
jgi:hypothetical protein